mgnify:CR=1 FL=1
MFILLVVSSCGYQPIYSKNKIVDEALLSVSVKNIKDRSGQILKNSLINKINPEGKKVITKYKLNIEINEAKTNLAYRKDMAATRTDLEINVLYSLRNIKSGEVVYQDESSSISSFDVVESVYASLVAENDAREKSLKVLSDQIYTNLVIFFNQ